MSYPFIIHDGGRSSSKRPRQKNDCVVRAVALATSLPYDTVYDLMAEGGRKSSQGFHLREWLATQNNVVNSYRFVWEPYPACKGLRRMNPVDFADEHPRGTFICKTAGHVYAVINGVAHDLEPTYDESCIYGAWWVYKIG